MTRPRHWWPVIVLAAVATLLTIYRGPRWMAVVLVVVHGAWHVVCERVVYWQGRLLELEPADG